MRPHIQLHDITSYCYSTSGAGASTPVSHSLYFFPGSQGVRDPIFPAATLYRQEIDCALSDLYAYILLSWAGVWVARDRLARGATSMRTMADKMQENTHLSMWSRG